MYGPSCANSVTWTRCPSNFQDIDNSESEDSRLQEPLERRQQEFLRCWLQCGSVELFPVFSFA